MILRMNHISFTVEDLSRSISFYNDTLGLSLLGVADRDPSFSAAVTGIPNARLRIAYLAAPNCAVELIQYLDGAGVKADTRTCNVGSAHVCFEVVDVDNLIDRICSSGGRLAGARSVVPAGPNLGRHVAYVEDPDGNTIELLSVELRS
jgi:catechol 2,3-dioxygenase-like lactoylglutathione lyase family enzyme